MLVAAVAAGALTLLTVRRQRPFLLALLRPVLVLLYLFLFNLMQGTYSPRWLAGANERRIFRRLRRLAMSTKFK